MMGLLGFYCACVAGLTFAEYRSNQTWQYILKPLAAFLFVMIAIIGGALYWDVGHILLWGLVACAVGDVLLLSRKNPIMFQMGMLAFAAGHIFYAYALFLFGQSGWLFCGIIAAALLGGYMFRYLRPHLPQDMRIPVAIYTLVISVMLMMAIGTGDLTKLVPALLFSVSDMAVGRDRFVKREPVNALAITPLYFGAQALFAMLAWI